MVGAVRRERRPTGFAFSDTAFRIFILMASRRLNSDRFFTADYTPAVYTQAGMDWIDDNSMATVLLRHYPQLRPAIGALPNAFEPWARAVPGSGRRPPPGQPRPPAGSTRAIRPPSSAPPRASSVRCSGRAAREPSPTAAAGAPCCWAPAACWPGWLPQVSYALLWRGKVVNARKGRLKNLISALSVPAIAAAVYKQDSWYDGKPCIVLDYSKTSLVAHMVRDEIREVAPGVYLGLVFWGRRHVLDFALDFTRPEMTWRRRNRDADCPADRPRRRRLLSPRGALHLRRPAAAERPVPVAVAAGAAGGVPLPAAVRPVAAAAAVRLGAVAAERAAAGRASRARRGAAAAGRGAVHPGDHRRARQVHPGELAARAAPSGSATPRPSACCAPSSRCCRTFRRTCGTACSPSRATYPAWVRFSGPGPYAPPDLEDFGQCSVGIKVMGVPGPKLMEDERFTQDLILVSPASFVTPNIHENAKLQRWVRAKAPLVYAINPFDSHLLHLFMQLLYSPMHANPLEVQYYSNVPFLLGEGQAVQYSLKPRARAGRRIPARPAENYLRDAMVSTLDGRAVDVRLHGAGADRSAPDADRGRHGQMARGPVPVRTGGAAAAAGPALRLRRAARVRRRAALQPLAQPARSTSRWGTPTGRGSRCTGSWRSCARP